MRLRAVATVLATSGLLAAAVLRCALPPEPPGPQALPTRQAFVGAAIVSVSGLPIDRAALVASLKELEVGVVILKASASATGETVNEAVSLAIDLQRALGDESAVLIGTYESTAYSGLKMETLLLKDPAFNSCYPGGTRLDTEASVIGKLRICSQDISKKIAAALQAQNASPRIGCYITHQPELADNLTDEGKSNLEAFFRDAASACGDAKRRIAVSTLLTRGSGDPVRAATLLRETLQESPVGVLILQDGVGTFDPAQPRRAVDYYRALRDAITDREPRKSIWANLEAFDCEPPSCARSHPTTFARFNQQLCGARARVDGIVTEDYLHHLGGRSLLTPGLDASADGSAELKAIFDDTDAAVQLRSEYRAWDDAGAPCTAAK